MPLFHNSFGALGRGISYYTRRQWKCPEMRTKIDNYVMDTANGRESQIDIWSARDKDRWLSSVRMPFEGVFSKQSNKARYRGVRKNQFQAFMQALAHNLKRLVKIQAPHPTWAFSLATSIREV
jgi:hypothetical protein